MDKKIAGLIGVVATLGVCNAAEAATPVNPEPTDVLHANSYADLLQPIPNALTTLQALDATSQPLADDHIELAQFYYHHHHHHHRWHRAPRIVVVPPRWHHHHHHHRHFYRRHHHHHFYRGDD